MIDDFIRHYRSNRLKYRAWGDFVVDEISKMLVVRGYDVGTFLKVPPQVRVKSESSIAGKIVRYDIKNPFQEIVDVVGVRFVVLLTTDIKILEECITSSGLWVAKLTRDIEERQRNNPELFDYQSTHYSLSPVQDIKHSDLSITSEFICEVQIRTILQHAYAELTHDNIYKPIKEVSKKAKRIVARSMALMESTDHLFCETIVELEKDNRQRNDFYASLSDLYKQSIQAEEYFFSDNFNYEIIEIYSRLVGLDDGTSKVIEYWELNKILLPRVQQYARDHFLFKQPVCLLLFWLAENSGYETTKIWPYGSLLEELRLIYSTTGAAIGDGL